MDTVNRVVSALVRVLRCRLFSISALAVACAVLVAYVTINRNAVTIADGSTSRVEITVDENSQYALAGAAADAVAAGSEDQQSGEEASAARIETSENRDCLVQIKADGVSRIVSLSGGTVSQAIRKVGVEVGQFDKVSVPLDTPVSDGLDIQIDRVAYEEYTETKTIDYKFVKEYTSTIVRGKTQIKQAGQEGQKVLTYRRCYENGAVIGTELVNEQVATAAVDEIKLVGTSTRLPVSAAPFDIPLNSSGQPLSYSAVYTGRATAYSSDHGNAGTYTASGRRASVGVVAVNPNRIPYGTKLYIVSPDGSYVYGYAVAGDTGTACMAGDALVDLYFNTYDECCSFGAKKMNVYVIG